MNNNNQNPSDSNERMVSVYATDMLLNVELSGTLEGPRSSKIDDKEIFRIFLADNTSKKSLSDLKEEFNSFSKRQKRRILTHRRWMIKSSVIPNGFEAIRQVHSERIEKLSTRTIHFTEEQISNFTSQTPPPKFEKKKKLWERMTKAQRLHYHFDEIAEGNKYTYQSIIS